MKNTTRKSTALISMVLVPLGLAGLGFTGCDDQSSSNQTTYSGSDTETTDVDATPDFGDEDDVFTLDPVPAPDFPPRLRSRRHRPRHLADHPAARAILVRRPAGPLFRHQPRRLRLPRRLVRLLTRN